MFTNIIEIHSDRIENLRKDCNGYNVYNKNL